MKNIIYMLMLLSRLFSLDSISSLPENQQKMISKIIEVLELPANENSKKLIFDRLSDFFTSGWSSHWTTNHSHEISKIKNSKTQICDVTINNNNRVVNFVHLYILKEKNNFLLH